MCQSVHTSAVVSGKAAKRRKVPAIVLPFAYWDPEQVSKRFLVRRAFRTLNSVLILAPFLAKYISLAFASNTIDLEMEPK